MNNETKIYSFDRGTAILTTLNKAITFDMINDAIGAGKDAQYVCDRINKLYGDGYAYALPVMHHTDHFKPEFVNLSIEATKRKVIGNPE